MRHFAVLHVSKSGGNQTLLGKHIDRDNVPKNADPDRQHLNQHYIETGQSLTKDINDRIQEQEARTPEKTKVRKNSVKALNFVLTGSHAKMKQLEAGGKGLQDWIQENRKFMEDRYGKENLVRFSLHMDERTPHIHAVVVPITADGRLSARDVLGGPKDLTRLQDLYAERMNQFGLSRGLENSRATHTGVKEYYARINKPMEAEISLPEPSILQTGVQYHKKIESGLEGLIWAKKALEEKAKDLEAKVKFREAELRGKDLIINNSQSKEKQALEMLKKNSNQAQQNEAKLKESLRKYEEYLLMVAEGKLTKEHPGLKEWAENAKRQKEQQQKPSKGQQM